MKFIKKNIAGFAVFLFVFLSPFISLAQNSLPPAQENSGRIVNPLSVNTIQGFIKMVLEGAIRIGMPIIALAIIYCGFLFVFARGKPAAIEKARDALLYTVIGAAILLGSWAIAQLISETVRAL